MDKSAVATVVQGTLVTSAFSAFATGLYGITTRKQGYGILAGAAAANSGITALTFFSIREFAISPLLVSTLPWPQFERRRRELADRASGEGFSVPLTWSDMRMNKTLDTAMSGTITGGVLRGWKAGPPAIIPGALTTGTVCLVLQLMYNELVIARLKYLSRMQKSSSLQIPTQNQEPAKPMTERILGFLGIRTLSDEEYLLKMKKTRDGHLRRIEELERQLEEEQTKENLS